MNPLILKLQKRHLLLEKDGYKSVNAENACLVTIDNIDNSEKEYFLCKLHNKPSLDIKSTEIPYLNGSTWIPRRYNWSDLTFTLIREFEESTNNFVNWLRTSSHYATGRCSESGFTKKNLTLNLFDKNGDVFEVWRLFGALITNVTFGGGLEEQVRFSDRVEYPTEIECTICFDRALLHV